LSDVESPVVWPHTTIVAYANAIAIIALAARRRGSSTVIVHPRRHAILLLGRSLGSIKYRASFPVAGRELSCASAANLAVGVDTSRCS
jgi:hypothetical protein